MSNRPAQATRNPLTRAWQQAREGRKSEGPRTLDPLGALRRDDGDVGAGEEQGESQGQRPRPRPRPPRPH